MLFFNGNKNVEFVSSLPDGIFEGMIKLIKFTGISKLTLTHDQ